MTEVRLDPTDIARMVSMRQRIEKRVTAEYDATPMWLLYPRTEPRPLPSSDDFEARRIVDIAAETRRRFMAWCAREGL